MGKVEFNRTTEHMMYHKNNYFYIRKNERAMKVIKLIVLANEGENRK